MGRPFLSQLGCRLDGPANDFENLRRVAPINAGSVRGIGFDHGPALAFDFANIENDGGGEICV